MYIYPTKERKILVNKKEMNRIIGLSKKGGITIIPLNLYFNNKGKQLFNIAGKLTLNEWKGQSNVEFIIDDISVNKTFKNEVPSSIG